MSMNEDFSKKGTKTDKKYFKKCSSSLEIMEMQIPTTFHSIHDSKQLRATTPKDSLTSPKSIVALFYFYFV